MARDGAKFIMNYGILQMFIFAIEWQYDEWCNN